MYANKLDRRPLFFLGTFVLLVPLTIGCGGKGTVSGTVTLDGQPLPAGTIAIIPSKGQGVSSQIQDGKYTLEKVPTGPATITVETDTIKKQLDAAAMGSQGNNRSAGGRMSKEMLAQMPENARAQVEAQQKASEDAAKQLKDLQAKYRHVPEKYSDSQKSGLTLQVTSGPNSHDVQLSSK